MLQLIKTYTSVYSKTIDEHIEHLKALLNAVKNENIKLKLSKCKFAQRSVTYLGHYLSKNEISPINDNTRAIKEFPMPKNVKNVQQFLGKVNYYHRFIPNAPKVLKPLYNLLKKNVDFTWNEECQKSFESIKELLLSKPILSIYNPNETCYLFTDASKLGIGAVLKQKQHDKILHPIGYFSKKLLPYQCNYTITELECLAIVEAINFWHHYLYGNKFIVITDHNALKWLRSIKKPRSRLFNWSLKLDQYTFDVKYQPGKLNAEADCLSRNAIDLKYNNNDHIKVVNILTKGELINSPNDEFKGKISLKKFFIKDNLVCNRRKNFIRVYVPNDLRLRVINETHTKFGHIGLAKMITHISKIYFWPDLAKSVKQVLDKCKVCSHSKIFRPVGELSHVAFATKPLEWISIDTLGTFKDYGSKKKYAHLAIDHLTRFLWFYPSETRIAKDFITLIRQIMSISKPKNILADKYASITSTAFKQFLNEQEIQITYITTDSPHSNGLIERANQTLLGRMRSKWIERKNENNWVYLMKCCVDEYNKTIHSITKYSPLYLLTGTDDSSADCSIDEAREIAKSRTVASFEKAKSRYETSTVKIEFKRGDLVLLKNKMTLRKRKLDPMYVGPFRVVEKKSNVIYEIQRANGGKMMQVHIAKLKPYNM